MKHCVYRVGCLPPNGIPTDRTFAKDSGLSDETAISPNACAGGKGRGPWDRPLVDIVHIYV